MSRKCSCISHSGSEPWHGKASGYHYHRCRCPNCTEAHKVMNHRYVTHVPTKYPQLAGLEIGSVEWRRAYRKLRHEDYAVHARRRRTQKQGNGCIPYVDTDIFERDLWTCQLCHHSVNPELPRNDRWGATIDHKMPISLGGADVPENVQLAHWICNVRKKNHI